MKNPFLQTCFMPSDVLLCLPLSWMLLVLCKTYFVLQMKDASVKGKEFYYLSSVE